MTDGVVTDGSRSPTARTRPRWRSPLAVALLVATLLGVAELPFAAFMADDFIQLGSLEGVLPGTPRGPFDLYTFSDGVPAHVRSLMDAGALPWFFGPDFKMAFFRPLSSAVLALDHAIWGLWPVGYRVQGVVWFVALVAALGIVLRRVLPGPIGALALIVFTISGIHGSLFWNATRHVVVAGALGTFALAAHLRWREEGWRPGALLALGGFALSMTASEAWLGVVTYLFAYEALAAPGSRRARLAAASGALGLVAIYLVGHRVADLGTAGGGGYLDPLKAPVGFLLALPGRWLFLAGALVAGGNADVWALWPDLRGTLSLIGGALVLGLALMLRAVWASASREERRGVRWLIAGAAASAVAFVGTPIGSRCLVLPMLGGSAAIAFVLWLWWAHLRHRLGVPARALSAGCVALIAIHLVLAPIGRLAAPIVLRQALHERLVTVMAQAELDPGRLSGQRLVVLRAPDFIVGLHPFFFRALYRMPMPLSWRTLSWASGEHRFTRSAPEVLDLELLGGEIDAPGLRVGEAIELDGMRATVLARGDHGPTRVEFRFDRPLDDPGLYLLAWRDGRLRHVPAPPVGGEVTF